MSAKTGEAKLVETEGDTFPLGILEDANYEETRLQLEPGDKVVFYTDGIVEAMNEKEEMYGFETASGSGSEGKIHGCGISSSRKYYDKVNAFAGGAPQHDDLTVIVVSVDA